MRTRIASVQQLNALRDDVRAGRSVADAARHKRILLCAGAGCIASGSPAVKDALQKELQLRGLDQRVSIIETGCLGPCAGGPVIQIDDVFYEKLKPQDSGELVAEHLMRNRPVHRLTHKRADGKPVPNVRDIDFFKRQTKIVLRNCGLIDPQQIEEYIGRDGYQALAQVLEAKNPDAVIDALKQSGLRGRGGAGFPTALKWRFTRQAAGQEKYVVCNADEGDPGAFMDRSVLEGDPHSVLGGNDHRRRHDRRSRGFVYVRARVPSSRRASQRRHHAGARMRPAWAENILGTGFDFELEIRMGSGAFVCGEETAPVDLDRGKPRRAPPPPPLPCPEGAVGQADAAQQRRDLRQRARRSSSTAAPGMRPTAPRRARAPRFSPWPGRFRTPGWSRCRWACRWATSIYDIGGGIPGGKEFKAAQIGGPSGGCIPRQHLNVPLDYESLAELGAIMGSGGLIVMDEDSCMVDVARFFLEFVQEESCGKCVPCRVGTKRMLEIVTRICNGQGEEADVDRLIELGEMIKDTSLCGLGQTAPNPVLSTIRHFGYEYVEHIRDKRCRAGVCPVAGPCPLRKCLPGQRRHSRLHLAGGGKALRRGTATAPRTQPVRGGLLAGLLPHLRGQVPPLVARCPRVDPRRQAFHGRPGSDHPTARGAWRTSRTPSARSRLSAPGPPAFPAHTSSRGLGYRPTVFEAKARPGGMLVQAIPPTGSRARSSPARSA